MITNDAVILGILIVVLYLILSTASDKRFEKFYRFVPPLLLCYLVPALLVYPLGIVVPSSGLYHVASRYLLPASMIWLCLSIDLKGVIGLGSKALIMFFAATLGIVIGGPIALYITMNFFPDAIAFEADSLWRGLSTIAGSWIGGGANQTAMKEIFEVSDELFGVMVVIDIIVANAWMGILLYGVAARKRIDRWLKSDTTAIDELEQKVTNYRLATERIPSRNDLLLLAAVGFGGTALSHFLADIFVVGLEPFKESLASYGLHALNSTFFWLIVCATTIGFLLSFTRYKSLEGVGASHWGGIFIYILVATIGLKMDIERIFDHMGLFVIGLIWIIIHVLILLITAKIIKAPYFFVAVGSQANIGGAASAPVVASAFNPSLAAVGVLMAVLGYALGTYGALMCAYLMQMIST